MILKFDPFVSAVEAPFWHALSQIKIDVLKLDDSLVSINAYYYSGFRIATHEYSGETAPSTLVPPALLCLGPNSLYQFDESRKSIHPNFAYNAPGQLKNTNTIEEFKLLDKNKLFKEVGEQIWNDIKTGLALEEPHLLNRFLVITFADLKKFKFYYWFGFPALTPPTDKQYILQDSKPIFAKFSTEEISSFTDTLEKFRGLNGISYLKNAGFFLVKKLGDGSFKIGKLTEIENFWKTGEKITVGFADPSLAPDNPGWPLRNFLFLLKSKWNIGFIRVICLRESPGKKDISSSIVIDVELPETGDLFKDPPKIVGWEKNSQGNLGPRIADLAPLMDPKRLADTAVDLNLKLMKWRLVPTLDLENISQQRCLLFGAGTLGCYVARLLMAWGVRNISFIDNGKVSFSNPVRQPLFEFNDCLDGGKQKAVAAAESLKKIFPGVCKNAKGYDISIPMPGHTVTSQQKKSTEETVKKISKLVQSHDVLFLLTDSRESRWLPTVFGAFFEKIVLTTALGFDTFLVMRHGMKGKNPYSVDSQTESKYQYSNVDLGCYFCNDVVAPSDSLKDRTLDQQCTVTRPGISALASSLVVELLMNILNHEKRCWAEPATNPDPSEPTTSELGLVPHQIRGYQTHFTNLLVVGQSYDKCTACSPVILQNYKNEGFEFLFQAFNSSTYLEDLTGLSEMHKQTDDADLDWDEDMDDE
ncbi:Autophagy protein 7 [Nowakowskiella sp. JEL0078]|nr:Autophagy protein 7 [Nowakowskiella sp. JEL0078]